MVPHTLIRFNDGEMAYLTKRIDRDQNGTKYLMEDLCQISERITLDKYKSSYEKAAKLIKLHSSAPMLDLVNFWEVVVFSWITGNSDMHLKNSRSSAEHRAIMCFRRPMIWSMCI